MIYTDLMVTHPRLVYRLISKLSDVYKVEWIFAERRSGLGGPWDFAINTPDEGLRLLPSQRGRQSNKWIAY